MTARPPLPELPAGLDPASTSLLASLWRQFNTEFPTIQHCLEELCKRASDDGSIRCRHCGSQHDDKPLAARVIICRRCRQSTWLTAGTFFDHIRLPRPWLAAIWFMERGVTMSSCQFHKLTGVAYSTAWNIFKKVTTVIESEMVGDAQVVPSALFSPVICRRSRETPAGSHPLAELEDVEQRAPSYRQTGSASLPAPASKLPVSSDFGLRTEGNANSWLEEPEGASAAGEHAQPMDCLQISPQEQKIYDLLAGQEHHFDILCARTGLPASEVSSLLTFLELAGHVRRLPGERYVRTVDDQSRQLRDDRLHTNRIRAGITAEAEMLVERVITYVRGHYQGVSRKYLQNYLAAYWCHVDRERWYLGSLLKACFRFGRIRVDEIRAYAPVGLVRMRACQ